MGKIEPTENLHQPFCTLKFRKVITHECPYINVLGFKTSSGLNVETEQGMKWCSGGETESIENLYLENRILALAIMKNTRNSCHHATAS